MSTAIERLDAMLAWPDASTIEYAKQWIAAFQAECGENWQEPSFVNLVPFGDDEVCFEWSAGKRKLTLYVSETEVMAFQIWGRHQIVESTANTPEERSTLWQWLTEKIA